MDEWLSLSLGEIEVLCERVNVKPTGQLWGISD